MMRRTVVLLCLSYVASLASAQQAPQFPPLTITGTRLDSTVTYDAARQVYRYTYTIVAPSTNHAPIEGVHLDLSGRVARPQSDPGLAENVMRHLNKQPATTIPVGITVPDPGAWRGGITPNGMLFLYSKKGLLDPQPGTSQGGFVIESRLGPGLRNVVFHPSDAPWEAIYNAMPDDQELENPPSTNDYLFKTTAFGPADLTDADLFDGGGQQPAEVNKFLRYAAPRDTRNKVPASSTFNVIVYYGKTINPATFSATLDGVDITSRFRPTPGGADVVTIAIGTATTRLHLSVDGAKASGGKGTDTDTLTFLPQ